MFCTGLLLATQAQPSLNSSNTNPQAGENFAMHLIAFLDAGQSGANVTWDFSALTINSPLNFNFVNASSTPYGSSIPAATVAYQTAGSYDYYSTSASSYARVGAYVQGVVLNYSDAEDIIRYPCSYNSSFTDNFSVTFTNQGVTYSRAGTIEVEADAYGTLILPDGTVNDVLRLKSVENYTDDYVFQGFPQTIDYYSEIYMWYKPGIHYPLLTFTHFDSDISFAEYGSYMNPATVGLDDIFEKTPAMSIYPNPATSEANIKLELKEPDDIKLTLVNSIGQQVTTVTHNELSPGMHQFSLDVNSYPRGIYFVKIEGNGYSFNQKLSVQ